MAEATLLLPDAAPVSASLEDLLAGADRIAWRLKRRASDPPVNHALTATITATSSHTGYSVTALRDAKHSTVHLGATPAVFPFDYVLDFSTAKTFSALDYVSASAQPDSSIRAYEIAVSSNGADWTTVASGEFGVAAPTYTRLTTVTFAEQTARYLRLRATSNWGGAYSANASEVRVYSTRTDLIATATGYAPSAAGGTIASVRDGNVSGTYWYATHYGFRIEIDLASTEYFDVMQVWDYGASAVWEHRYIDIYGSTDNSTWALLTQLRRASTGVANIVDVDFGEVQAYRYLRLDGLLSGAVTPPTQPGALYPVIRLFEAAQSAFDSASPSEEWEHDFGASATLANADAIEDCEGTATLRYQWGLGAAASPALNGSWLTAAQLATALDGQAGQYLRLSVQFNSGGTDRATFRGLSVEPTFSGGGGGGRSIRFEGVF